MPREGTPKEIEQNTSHQNYFSHMTLISAVISMSNKFPLKIIEQICSLKYYQL
jgi:hypothetical protein